MRTLLAMAVLAALLVSSLPGQAQATSAPPFVIGPNLSYCHATEDSLSVWMNTLLDDGGGVPYYIFGSSTTTIPVVGLGVDPVVNQVFEVRIALTPVLSQDLLISGTVNVQAYIGGGTATSGVASIGTSLVAGGTELGAAAAKPHQMTPQAQAGTNYNAISWTFDVADATVPAGTTLEWLLSGTVQGGNNVFLACHEGRGRSSIEIPVTAFPAGGGDGGSNSSTNSSTNATSSSTVSVSSSASSSSASTSPSTSASSSSSSTNGTASNTTTNATAGDEKDSPSLPLAAAGLALFAVAAAVRRRLR